MMKNNIIIITGGTGGHVIPALNFFNYVENKTQEVFLVTDIRGSKYLKNINKNKIIHIQSSHLVGNIYFKLIASVKLIIGFLQSLVIFLKFRPKIIVSFGSYASLTPLICFMFFRIFFKTKLYIHEQNSIIGQTNRIFAKFANIIFVNFNKEYPSIAKYKEKISIVGLPQKINFNDLPVYLNGDKINFLIFAGSQGSFDILSIFIKILNELIKISDFKNINFIIQCPLEKQNEITKLLKEKNCNFEISSFFENFENILAKADLALCRSGAGTINDLINYKIPAIICPLPSAKDNHQFENAKILTNNECGIIINKEKFDIDKVILFIDNVINDKNFKKSLLNKYSKINIKNTNDMMWTIINNEQKK